MLDHGERFLTPNECLEKVRNCLIVKAPERFWRQHSNSVSGEWVSQAPVPALRLPRNRVAQLSRIRCQVESKICQRKASRSSKHCRRSSDPALLRPREDLQSN